MGRTTQNPTYRDDPDAVSLRTTPDDYTYDDAPEITTFPPSYADSEADSAAAPTAPLISHIPPITTRMNHDSDVVLSRGVPQVTDTQTVMDARYDTDPVYLEEGIREFANLAPIPLVYILGTHKETVKKGDKKETRDVTDFRIVMNMQRYLWHNFSVDDTSTMTFAAVSNNDKTYRGGFLKKRAPGSKQDIEVGSSPPSAREWYHRYCASSSLLRVFRLRREVTGFDQTFLKNRIEGLIRSTNYRGHLSITFPIEDQNIDIYTSNRINQWRQKTWIRWVFYLTFLWIFTWPYLFFATKRYAVVVAYWPFSRTDSNGNKRYTTVSEEQWFEKWHVGIRRLVLDRFEGVASEGQLEGVIARPADPPMPGTISTGHAGIDNAVGFLQQGLQVAGALSRGGNLSRGLQGGWGYDC